MKWFLIYGYGNESLLLSQLEQNRQISCEGGLHLEQYVWTLDKPMAALSAAM